MNKGEDRGPSFKNAVVNSLFSITTFDGFSFKRDTPKRFEKEINVDAYLESGLACLGIGTNTTIKCFWTVDAAIDFAKEFQEFRNTHGYIKCMLYIYEDVFNIETLECFDGIKVARRNDYEKMLKRYAMMWAGNKFVIDCGKGLDSFIPDVMAPYMMEDVMDEELDKHNDEVFNTMRRKISEIIGTSYHRKETLPDELKFSKKKAQNIPDDNVEFNSKKINMKPDMSDFDDGTDW